MDGYAVIRHLVLVNARRLLVTNSRAASEIGNFPLRVPFRTVTSPCVATCWNERAGHAHLNAFILGLAVWQLLSPRGRLKQTLDLRVEIPGDHES